MKNKILDYLQLSSQEYDELILQTYFNWCASKSTSDNQLQEMLANSGLNKWFLKQYTQMQNQFVNMIESSNVYMKDPNYHYNGCVAEIFNVYPNVILNTLNHKPEFALKIRPAIFAN